MNIQTVYLCNNCSNESFSSLEAAICCLPSSKYRCASSKHLYDDSSDAEYCDSCHAKSEFDMWKEAKEDLQTELTALHQQSNRINKRINVVASTIKEYERRITKEELQQELKEGK